MGNINRGVVSIIKSKHAIFIMLCHVGLAQAVEADKLKQGRVEVQQGQSESGTTLFAI